MPAIEANIDKFYWGHRGATGRFVPNGTLHFHGGSALQPNPPLWSSGKPLYAARLIVGFNVRDRKRWTMDDVIRIVKRVRKKQVGNPSSSFLLQRGMYAHEEDKAGRRLVVEEQGAQVIIVNTPDLETPIREFEQQMIALAETLARELKQESVILEIQRGGVSRKTYGVGP